MLLENEDENELFLLSIYNESLLLDNQNLHCGFGFGFCRLCEIN